jgi:putative sterol carrier protein
MEPRASDLFARIGAEGRDTRLVGTRGTVKFDIRGAGIWRVHFDNGRYLVEASDGPADLVVACDEADFVRVTEGKQNFVTAVLQNRFEASGNVALLLKLNTVLSERAQAREASQELHA